MFEEGYVSPPVGVKCAKKLKDKNSIESNYKDDSCEDRLESPHDRSWCLDDFKIGPILGTGSFGRVVLATELRSGGRCAIKILSKAHVIKNQQIEHIRAEKQTLLHVNHPCIVRLYGGFQDKECLYLVMEFVPGGEFFSYMKTMSKYAENLTLSKRKANLIARLPEATSRFYAAQILLAFEYLHSQNIIYRDLKPENLLLTTAGNIKLTDFGFAKFLLPTKRTYTLCGTPDYLAPEIILNKGHGKAVDWWAFGVLIYEMLAGYPPFYEEDPSQTYQRILHGRFTFPPTFPILARDLVRKLLQTNLSKRYGCLAGGIGDIKTHIWFRRVDWAALKSGTADPPIRPSSGGGPAYNFERYDLPPLTHLFKVSEEDQALFAEA